jgi:hypothetical protein
LIDAEIGRNIVLHVAESEPALDFANSFVIELGADALCWSGCHIFFLTYTTSLDELVPVWN